MLKISRLGKISILKDLTNFRGANRINLGGGELDGCASANKRK